MPTISFSHKDLEKMVGRKLPIDKLEKSLEFCKAEIDKVEGDDITISVGDTNQPYLWSVEGVARLLRGVLGIEKGIAKLNIKKADKKIFVDKSVEKIRSYLSAFIARGKKVDDYLLKQMIQLQEKVCEGYGRRRQKVSIGIYSYKKIKFPLYYKAVDPESIEFVPLDFKREMTQAEILETHPKGKEYAWILKDCKKFPIFVDDTGEVLSFPPIINSQKTGKVEIGEEDLLVETTGTDLNAVNLATNIFAYALADRGFTIEALEINYGKNKITTPKMFNEKIKIKTADVDKLLGLKLNDKQITDLLKKARFDFNKGIISVPEYRQDILHWVDVVEDIGIMYDYEKIESSPLTSFTVGNTSEMQRFIDALRELCTGLGYQEVFSTLLTNKEILYNKMNVADLGTIEIKNVMSENYSVLRTWIVPTLMEVLSTNKHIEYPQKIFEQGIVVSRKKEDVIQHEKLALVSAHADANFTEARQVLEAIFKAIGVTGVFENHSHDSFIPGRVAKVLVNGKEVAFVGEMHPKVLSDFGIDVPVVGFELDVDELFRLRK